MRPPVALALAVTALLGAAAFGADPPKTAKPQTAATTPAKTGTTATKPAVPSFSLAWTGEVPEADGRVKPKAETEQQSESSAVRAADAKYDVLKVDFAKQFVRSPKGQVPVAPFQSVALRGNPPTTEKF